MKRRLYKKLDVRYTYFHKQFSCQKFKFGLVHPKESTTIHGTDTPKEVKPKHEEVRGVIKSGLNEIH